jgi:uncharacterized membrane protein
MPLDHASRAQHAPNHPSESDKRREGGPTDPEIRRLAEDLLRAGPNDLSEWERRVLRQIARRRHVSRNRNRVSDEQMSFGDWLADRVAAIGGSWSFVIGFGVLLLGWIVLNSEILSQWSDEFDPYPFVFLNLILSMLAAVQAPIIMMSQNRQAAKDRIAAALDYEVNLKAELEIMVLHEKLDALRAAHAEMLLKQQDAKRDASRSQEQPPGPPAP